MGTYLERIQSVIFQGKKKEMKALYFQFSDTVQQV